MICVCYKQQFEFEFLTLTVEQFLSFIATDCDIAIESLFLFYLFFNFGNKNKNLFKGLPVIIYQTRQEGWVPASWSNMNVIIYGPTTFGPPTHNVDAIRPYVF